MSGHTASGYRSARRRAGHERSLGDFTDGVKSKRLLFTSAGRSDGIIRVRPAIAAGRGFTLIEVLLATVLLAAGLALAFATLGAATQTVRRGEMLAQRNEQMRAVESFLRRRLTGARDLAFGYDGTSGLPLYFVGDPKRMRFVADLPAYLGHGGPYLHDLQVESGQGDDGMQLLLDLQVVQGGQHFGSDPPRPSEVLAENLQTVRFRYRGLDDAGRLDTWQTHWDASARLPLQVAIDISDAQGRDWPALIIALPMARNSE